MLVSHGIVSMTRIIKKSTKQPLNIVKAYTLEREDYNRIIQAGRIKIGYTMIKVKPWEFGIQTNQCFNCCKFGHPSSNCKQPTVCLRCAGNHNFKNCTITEKDKYLCNNCKGCHAACSRLCPTMIKIEQEIKLKLQKKRQTKISYLILYRSLPQVLLKTLRQSIHPMFGVLHTQIQ